MRIAVFLLVAALVGAQTQSDAAKLQALTTRLLAGDTGIDFRELRRLCMRVSTCKPRSTSAELSRMSSALPRDAIQFALALLPNQIANAELYSNLALYYQRAGNQQEYARFNALGMRLIKPAIDGKDGKSPRTAFEVISDREQYYILAGNRLPYRPESIAGVDKLTESGHKYEKWRIRQPGTSQPVVVYFNVDLFQPKSTAVK